MQSMRAATMTTARVESTPDLLVLLKQASHVLATELTAKLGELGISPRGYCVLAYALKGEFTQKELAGMCSLDKTTMVVTLDELEEAGLAQRTPSSTDRRARIVSVTEAGTRKFAEAHTIVSPTQDDVLGSLPQHEREIVLNGLRRLVRGRLSEPVPCERPVRRPRGA